MMIFNDYTYFAKGGYQFKQMQTKPKIMVGKVYASKDFTRPFGTIDGSHYGRMDVMSWSNMQYKIYIS